MFSIKALQNCRQWKVFPLRWWVLVIHVHLVELIKIQNLAAPFKDSYFVGLV